MPTTKTAHKAGTTDAVLFVRFTIELPDPEQEGNFGLQGYDEDSVHITAPNAGLARHRAISTVRRINARTNHEVQYVRVTTREWVREVFDDPTYGHIVDAEAHELTEQYGYPADDGITWDDDIYSVER